MRAEASPASDLLTIDEAARALRRSRRWLYSNLARIAHVKLNDGSGGVLFHADDLREFLAQRRVSPAPVAREVVRDA